MKTEKAADARPFSQTEFDQNRADKPNTATTKTAELQDQVTLSQEALRKAERDEESRVDRTTRANGTKKSMPDPRYTAQAILDRELLGLKKFYS